MYLVYVIDELRNMMEVYIRRIAYIDPPLSIILLTKRKYD